MVRVTQKPKFFKPNFSKSGIIREWEMLWPVYQNFSHAPMILVLKIRSKIIWALGYSYCTFNLDSYSKWLFFSDVLAILETLISQANQIYSKTFKNQYIYIKRERIPT